MYSLFSLFGNHIISHNEILSLKVLDISHTQWYLLTSHFLTKCCHHIGYLVALKYGRPFAVFPISTIERA
jgi:hypothetical protein